MNVKSYAHAIPNAWHLNMAFHMVGVETLSHEIVNCRIVPKKRTAMGPFGILTFTSNVSHAFCSHLDWYILIFYDIKLLTNKIVSPAFKCYHWSSEEKAKIDAGGGILQLKKQICENHFGFIYTKGDDSKAFECGGCWCCQPRIQGICKGL